jgi:signal transduction histidine kinase
MKFWEKIFLCTLLIFEVFFVPASIYLNNSNFNVNLNMTIDSSISEEGRFCSSIESNLFLLRIQKASNSLNNKVDKQSIDTMVSTYLNSLEEQNIYIEVIDEKDKTIFSNLKINILGKRDELNTIANKVNYIIRDLNGQSYLFITQKLNLDDNNYKISYVKDISNIYSNRKYMFNLLLRLNILIAVILVLVTIVMSKFLVNPINRLIKSTQIIAGGNFSERVTKISDDEIGELSKKFNAMAEVVEDKINELEKLSADKQRFIDNLSHELRTPLTSIIGYADFLMTTRYDEEIFLNSLGFIYDEGKRLEKLTFKLMDLIILRKEDFKLREAEIDNLLVDIKNSLVPRLEEKNIQLEISSENISFLMDKDLLKILIINIVDNSIKASKNGGKIHLCVYRDEESQVVIEIKDFGIGIPKEDISKVFEPFFMVDKSRSKENSRTGVGLGLSLCAEIAKIHNAKIEIESNQGEGTILKIIFNRHM